MGGWMQKILGTEVQMKNAGNLPVQASSPKNLPAQLLKAAPPLPQALPNATVIYGIGASLLFVASFSLFWAGRWFSGFWVMACGVCLLGFALYLLKHQD
jgi:hypothetical protein